MRSINLMAAIVSFICSADAYATNFVEYTFTGRGSGVATNVNNQIGGTDFTKVWVGLSATFYVDLDFADAFLNGVNYSSNGVNSYSSIGPLPSESTYVSLSGNSISASDTYNFNYLTTLNLTAGLTGAPVRFSDITSGTRLSRGTFFYGFGNKFSGLTAEGTLTGFSVRSVAGPGPVTISISSTIAPVPEPASWAMMLGGFGVVGVSLRRRRKLAVSVTYA